MLEWVGVRIRSRIGDVDADPLRDPVRDPALCGGAWEAEARGVRSSWLAVGVGDQRRSPTAARLGDRRLWSLLSGPGESFRL